MTARSPSSSSPRSTAPRRRNIPTPSRRARSTSRPSSSKFIQDHGSSLLSEAFYSMLVAKSAETILPLIK